MSEQFMQEVQEEESALEALQRKVSQAAGTGADALAADEMIRANGEAEAIEMDALKDTVLAYQAQIDELEELHRRNNALVDQMRRMNVETTRGVQDIMKASADALTENANALRESARSRSQEETKAAVEETTSRVIAAIDESQKKIEELLQQSDDFSHKENVRVYRNVQAATDQLLGRQTQELKEQLEEMAKPKKPAVTWVQVLTLLLAAGCVALEVLQILGIL